MVRQEGPDELHVAFATPRQAVTRGQSVVLYEGDDVVGGGWIEEVGERSHRNASLEFQK